MSHRRGKVGKVDSGGTSAPRRRKVAVVVAPPEAPPAYERFRELDRYRVEREWRRYEGTPQRDLFRELRSRFLDRHRALGPRTLDVGPGPGRFSAGVGSSTATHVLADLSLEMLRYARGHLGKGERAGRYDYIRADGIRVPFPPHRFSEVVALGNTLGFAEESASRLLESLAECVAASGTLILEIAPSSGERSRYLRRLPARAVGRLFEAPVSVIQSRIEREGFDPVPSDPGDRHRFRRLKSEEIREWMTDSGLTVEESLAVAPASGLESDRIQAVQKNPKAWAHLIELEERLGRIPARQLSAAAVLVAARAPPAEAMN
ncbi:MAG: methyltransferase domain-containing protein [Thermoplasmata archaeon]